jgi:iron-sulfur cluster assembly protein
MSDCGNVKKTFIPIEPQENLVPSSTGFDVSDIAAEKIKHFLSVEKKDLKTHGLKISVVKDGCSGNSYTMDLAELAPSRDAKDKVFEKNGAYVIVEKLSYLFVIGSILDYKETLLASGFELSNPNIKKSCSCGSSFSV